MRKTMRRSERPPKDRHRTKVEFRAVFEYHQIARYHALYYVRIIRSVPSIALPALAIFDVDVVR